MRAIPALTAALWVATALAQAPTGAQPAKPKKLSLRVIGAREPPPPQQQPADRFEVDQEAGELRFQSQGPDGRVRSYQVTLPIQVRPQVSSQVDLLTSGRILYRYHVTNRPGARQSIRLFAIAMDHPDQLSDIKAPEHWRPGMHSLAEWGTPSRYNWWPDAPLAFLIAPGGSAGPFSFSSAELPGLSHTYIEGDTELRSPPEFHMASPWILEKFNEATMGENIFVRVPVIGPKITVPESRQELVAEIQKEVRGAATRPEFAAIQQELISLADKIGTPEAAVMPAGKNQLQREFLAAMALNLTVLSAKR